MSSRKTGRGRAMDLTDEEWQDLQCFYSDCRVPCRRCGRGTM